MQAQKAHRLLSSVLGRSLVKRKYHAGENWVASYNDLPQPQGNWKTHYDAQQRKYNAHLMIGTAFAVGTLVIAKATGCLYFNYTEPAKAAPKNDY